MHSAPGYNALVDMYQLMRDRGGHVLRTAYEFLESLKMSLTREWNRLSADVICTACDSFRNRLKLFGIANSLEFQLSFKKERIQKC